MPAEQVVWLAVAMGMFRDRSIAEVVGQKTGGLRQTWNEKTLFVA